MALSVVGLYRDVLPKTNCRDCGFSTCLAFAGMVVSEKHPLKNCPHLESGPRGQQRAHRSMEGACRVSQHGVQDKKHGGQEIPKDQHSADLAFYFKPLPRVPVMLMFTDQDLEDDFPGSVKLLFDETIITHLDIESIMLNHSG
ncbi:MAG: DUF3786 domain-containing protein [Desulfobacterium sp.]|jgi:CO dehydrogenase/acetyl-CoA synthase gamma subunit (corrinoid Fe-S protein)|nr:DUF3786 domain-containing protein [Desulfobacterium sp.]